jgi:MoxR-like ATPase
MTQYATDVEAADALHQKYKQLKAEIGKVIIGQHDVVDAVLMSIFANGHTLLVGVPGLAKTLLVRTLSEVLDLQFSRIQFTPDLMPSDITGSEILDEKREFKFLRGPIFANIVLADEINRTPPKTQAALLEAMQEKSVTVNGKLHQLTQPFFVLATQNPIEQEGTYPLPEAQVDRFMLKVVLDYPKIEEERLIIRSNVRKEGLSKVNKVFKPSDIIRLRDLVKEVYLDEKIEQYIVDIVYATRTPERYNLPHLKTLITNGCSPRASINLALAGKAHAFLNNRAFVIPEDIRAIAKDVMRHRIALSYEAEAENMSSIDIINQIINRVEVP